MRGLILCNKTPFPPDDGSSVAIQRICEGLHSAGADLSMLCINTKKHFKDPASLNPEILKKYKIQTVFRDTDIGMMGLVLNLFTGTTYFSSRFYFREFELKLLKTLQENNFDFIQLEGIFMGHYIPIIREHSKAKIVIRTHNIEHLIWERVIKGERNIVRKNYLKLQMKRLKKFEKDALQSADAIVPITDVDKNYFVNWGVKGKFHVCPAGISLADYPLKEGESVPASVFHFGSMDWIPNEEAVLWFVLEVWPLVLRRVPEASFHILGRGMGNKVLELCAPGIVVHNGTVFPGEVYRKYAVMVIPLLSGSGMRIKMLEGMAYSNAIVSTSIGAEGIPVKNGVDCIIADTPEAFSGAVAELLCNPDLREKMGKASRKFVEASFDNHKLGGELYSFYKSL